MSFAFDQRTLRGVVKDIERLGKGRKMRQAEMGITVIISKRDWRALLGRKIKLLQVFSPGERAALRKQFGIHQKRDSIKVRIAPI